MPRVRVVATKTPPRTMARRRAGQKAREMVEDYLEAQGGEDSGFTFDRHERLLARQIAMAILEADGWE